MAGDVLIVKQRHHKAWDLPIPRQPDSATLRPFGQLIRSSQQRPGPGGRSVDCSAFRLGLAQLPITTHEQREDQAPARYTAADVGTTRSPMRLTDVEAEAALGTSPGPGAYSKERGARVVVAAHRPRDGRRR